ncbi:penicillin acylase family protein [Azotobacter chroococcum]
MPRPGLGARDRRGRPLPPPVRGPDRRRLCALHPGDRQCQAGGAQSGRRGGDDAALRARLAKRIGERAGLGSNVLAFGRQATGEEGALLFGNPHWYWGGPDRFYQMHLSIPGRLDVAGVAFLGVPVVMLGFNEQVAWSHTVSEARRFGLFELKLDAADPTRYLVDGRVEPMVAREVSVAVRDENGEPRSVARTLYSTRFGPVVDLGGHNAAFGWSATHALAIRDVNTENFRIFRNFFYWNQAKSLDEFIAIQRREAAVPWVNTVAIARGDGRVWYGDVGAVPNVTDELREACSTPLAKGFARLDAAAPSWTAAVRNAPGARMTRRCSRAPCRPAACRSCCARTMSPT